MPMRPIHSLQPEDQAAVEQAAAVFEQVLGLVKSNNLPGPAVPDLLARVVKICGKPNVSFNELSEFCRGHQALSARLLSLVNSAAYSRGGPPITVLENAVTRLGLRETSSVLHAVATRSYLVGKDPAIRSMTLENLERAYAVALVAQEMTKITGSANGGEAYAVGLFHNIGMTFLLYTVALMQDKGQSLPIGLPVLQILEQKRGAELNRIVCDQLGLPQIVVGVLSFPDKPSAEAANLIHCVHRSMWFADQVRQMTEGNGPKLDTEGEVLGVTAPVFDKLSNKASDWRSLLDAFSAAK